MVRKTTSPPRTEVALSCCFTEVGGPSRLATLEKLNAIERESLLTIKNTTRDISTLRLSVEKAV